MLQNARQTLMNRFGLLGLLAVLSSTTLTAATTATKAKSFRIDETGENPLTEQVDLSEFGDSFHYVRFQNGRLAVVAGTDGYSDETHEQLLILDEEGELLGTTPLEGNEYYPSSLVVSDTGLVAVKSMSSDSQTIEIFDSSNGAPEQILAIDGEKRTINAFSPFEEVLVVSKRISAPVADRSMPMLMRKTEYIDIRSGENVATCSAS